MARTMSDSEESVRYWLGEEGGPCTSSDRDDFNAGVRGVLAELDAERAAHEETRAEAEGWRNGQAQVQRDFDLLYADTQALKARLALAEAVCESCYQGDGTRNDPDCFSWDALAAWRAGK